MTVDPSHGKVVYVDPPDATGGLPPRADQHATGPSGLFILYTDTIVDVTIAGAGRTRKVRLGAHPSSFSGAMVVLP